MSDFTWGDGVRVKGTASSEKRPGAYASVLGTTVYLIEFADGSAIELSGEWLEKFEDDSGRAQ